MRGTSALPNATPWFSELELRYGKSEIDHVMDTYSLRTIYNPAGKQIKNANNPKRNTDTGRLKATFDWDKLIYKQVWTIWTTFMSHAMSAAATATATSLTCPTKVSNNGVFSPKPLGSKTDNQRWVAGLRHDQVKAHYDTARVTDPVLKHQNSI